MLLQGQTGPQTSQDGTLPAVRTAKTGEMVVSELHGRYYETNYRKNLFYSTGTGQTMTTVTGSMVGNILYNGNTSVNLVLQKIMLQVSVSSATMTGVALAYTTQATAPTGLTAATSTGSCFLGAASSQAKAYVAATGTAPVVIMAIAHNTAAINTVGMDQLVIDLEGSIIVPPNSILCLAAVGANAAAAAVTSTIFWEEVPV